MSIFGKMKKPKLSSLVFSCCWGALDSFCHRTVGNALSSAQTQPEGCLERTTSKNKTQQRLTYNHGGRVPDKTADSDTHRDMLSCIMISPFRCFALCTKRTLFWTSFRQSNRPTLLALTVLCFVLCRLLLLLDTCCKLPTLLKTLGTECRNQHDWDCS